MKKIVAKKKIDGETRVPYSHSLSESCLPLNLWEQRIFFSSLSCVDFNNLEEDIGVSTSTISKLSHQEQKYVTQHVIKGVESLMSRSIWMRETDEDGNYDPTVNAFQGRSIFSDITYDPKLKAIIVRFNKTFLEMIAPTSASLIFKLIMPFTYKNKYSHRLVSLLLNRYILSGKISPISFSVDEIISVILDPIEKVGKAKKGASLREISELNRLLEKTVVDINNYSNVIVRMSIEKELGEKGRMVTSRYAFSIEEVEGKSIETFLDIENLEQRLISHNIYSAKAAELIKTKSWNVIRRNIMLFESDKSINKKHPAAAGLLVAFINGDEEKKRRESKNFVVAPLGRIKQEVIRNISMFEEYESIPEIAEDKPCLKCNNEGGYMTEVPFNNDIDTRMAWQVCECVEMKRKALKQKFINGMKKEDIVLTSNDGESFS